MKRLILLLFLPAVLNAQPSPVVITSVGPLQLIVEDIMQGRGNIEILIDAQASPHHFQLKPSHLRKIDRADLLIWISNDFETGLARIHRSLSNSTSLLPLADYLPPQRLIGSGHDVDGHVWLSVENIKHIGKLIADRLSQLDAGNAQTYQNNARQLNIRLDRWLQQANERFREQKPKYITNHNFLAYLEQSLGIHSIGHLRNSHDHGGRLRSVAHLHHQLDSASTKCLLVDHLPASRQARQVAEQHQLQILHVNILAGLDRHKSIIDLLQQTTDTLAACR